MTERTGIKFTIPATRYTRRAIFSANLEGAALIVFEGPPTRKMHVFMFVRRRFGGRGFTYNFV